MNGQLWDANGTYLGETHEVPGGRVEATGRAGFTVGFYDPGTNGTWDWRGTYRGAGNSLAALVTEAAQEGGTR